MAKMAIKKTKFCLFCAICKFSPRFRGGRAHKIGVGGPEMAHPHPINLAEPFQRFSVYFSEKSLVVVGKKNGVKGRNISVFIVCASAPNSFPALRVHVPDPMIFFRSSPEVLMNQSAQGVVNGGLLP